MGTNRPLSFNAVAVLQAVASNYRYGFDIIDATDLSSSTVYPILGKLENRNLLRATWEDPSVARSEKRPSRKYYQITGLGEEVLAVERERYRLLERLRDHPALPVRPAKPEKGRA